MQPSDRSHFNPGRRLAITFILLIVLILGGNGLVVWQFTLAQAQTDRLVGANQQMILVLHLQISLLSFHRRLDDLALSKESHELTAEAAQLRSSLHDDTERTRAAVAALPPGTRVEPALWPTLEAIEIILPSQLDAVTNLGQAGDWDAARLRLANQLKPIESQTAILVDSVDRQATLDLSHALQRMRAVQRTILILVPGTAICSFLMAAFFGWSLARSIMEARMDERVTERVRIARELHDTLLQTIQASRILAVTALDGPANATVERQALENLSHWLDQAVSEARTALNSLRRSPADSGDLGEALRRIVAECRRPGIDVTISVLGDPKEMSPVLQEEVYRIGCEAIRNACEHAHASHLEVELRYAQDLSLRVKDDGVGIAPDVLASGKPEHFGLKGMRERASRVGGKFTLASTSASGTEMNLVVPGAAIFRNARSRQDSPLARLRGIFLGSDSPSKSL